MSELLDRIRREIRERVEAGRAAVLEYERLEAALYALSGACSRATTRPRVDGIGLETVGVAAAADGIPVDGHLRAGERPWRSATSAACGR